MKAANMLIVEEIPVAELNWSAPAVLEMFAEEHEAEAAAAGKDLGREGLIRTLEKAYRCGWAQSRHGRAPLSAMRRKASCSHEAVLTDLTCADCGTQMVETEDGQFIAGEGEPTRVGGSDG